MYEASLPCIKLSHSIVFDVEKKIPSLAKEFSFYFPFFRSVKLTLSGFRASLLFFPFSLESSGICTVVSFVVLQLIRFQWSHSQIKFLSLARIV